MKKIMFNDKYNLTAAVLAGTKTQTRRIINAMPKDPKIAYGLENETGYAHLLDGYIVVAKSKYKIGEILAVAQSYFDIKTSANSYRPKIWEGYKDWHKYLESLPTNGGGCYNKMSVKAELMPHKIEITNIRVERLQDISDADCLAEGILKEHVRLEYDEPQDTVLYSFQNSNKLKPVPKTSLAGYFDSAKAAYAALIDAISGKGTWASNPWAFVYDFDLIK